MAHRTVSEAMAVLADELDGKLTAQQQVDLAAALVLARTLDTGPELPQAGISKQLADLVSRLTPEQQEGGLLDELRRRRHERETVGRPDETERSARAE